MNTHNGLGLSIQNPALLSEDRRIHKEGSIGMGDYSDFNNNSQVVQNINQT